MAHGGSRLSHGRAEHWEVFEDLADPRFAAHMRDAYDLEQ